MIGRALKRSGLAFGWLLLLSQSAYAAFPGAPPPSGESSLPAPLQWLMGQILGWQRSINHDLREQIALLQSGDSLLPAFTVIGLAFAYGVFHAAGPGHGKMVVGTYLMSQRARLAQGIGLSFASAMIQAISAIAIVGTLAMLFDLGGREVLAQANMIEMASYGLVIMIGLVLGYKVLKGDDRCCHGHHDDHDHHHHNHHHAAVSGPFFLLDRTQWATAFAVGLRPCTGAILVLLFTFANGLYPIGIVATFTMALGVALTVSALGLASMGLNRAATGLAGGRDGVGLVLRRGLGLAGAVAIVGLGVVLLIGAWQGGGLMTG